MTAAAGRTLRVALLQLRAFDLAEHEAAWDELLRRIDEAAEAGPDLVVLPEASYPAYYLGSRAAYDDAAILPDEEVETALAERARRHGVAIAAGLVQRHSDGGLRNAAVLFAPSGIVGQAAKRFLWHFDRSWFTPGEASPVLEVGPARCGLFVCADGRVPEITRSLAVAGAELLIDCTAWVSSGRDPAALSNPQVDYMLAARAIENGAWIVVADKVGTEAGSIVYAGRSGVVDPRGRWRVQAPSDRPGVVHYELDLDEATGPLVARRPELYADAAVPGAQSRAAERAREPLGGEDAVVRVAAAAVDASPSALELMECVRSLARTLATQGVELLVLPDLAGADAHALSQRELLPLLEGLTAETGLMLAIGLVEREGARSHKTLYLFDRGTVLASYRQAHLDEAERAAGFAPGDEPPPVVESRLGALGLLVGHDALAPEVARSLKLRGAEIVAWCARPLDGATPDAVRVLARTRAAENRSYVVAAAGASEAGGAYVVEPSGAVAAEALAGQPLAVAADAHRGLARWHRWAPQTDPILDHRPAAYPELYGPAAPRPPGSPVR